MNVLQCRALNIYIPIAIAIAMFGVGRLIEVVEGDRRKMFVKTRFNCTFSDFGS